MGDLISRQAAIDALHTRFKDGFNEDKWWNSTHVLAAIEGLPPANCSEFPNNSDTISRQQAIDHWRLIIDATNTDSRYNMGFVDGLEFCISHLSTMPSAQPEIIYCGECKHMMPNGKCRQFADSTIRPSASDFCSAGERKDNG